MSDAQIHLAKTLCAMRWIALLNNRQDIAKSVERDMAGLQAREHCVRNVLSLL
jgi:hypothetical protein